MESNISLKMVSLDDLYHSLDHKVDLLTIDPDVLDNLTIKQFQNKLVPTTASCMCGSMTGNAHLNDVCFVCNTPVTEMNGTFKPVVWISSVGGRKFISPVFWEMINDVIKSGKFDSMAWLSNTRYKSAIGVPKVLTSMIADIPGFTRTYSYLLNNIDKVLQYLLTSQLFYSKRDRIRNIIELYNNNKDKIFSDYMALPNNSLFLVEDSAFSVKKTSLATGMIKSLAINYRDAVESNRDHDRSMSMILSELASIYSSNSTELLAGKKKLIRSNIYGTKVPCSFRTVMIPISGPHNYDDFKMPWIQGVILFRMLLINRLVIRKKQRYMDVCHRLDKALYNFDEEVYAELMDILREAKEMTDGKGIPIAMNRNPSQYRGSIILVYATEIKTDPMDFTSEYSPLLCASLNGD